MSLWIKICGNTSLGDALVAAEAGADALGFVFAPSPRRITAEQAGAITSRLPAGIEKIGVFVEAELEEMISTVQRGGLTGVQLHWDAPRELPSRLRERLPKVRILRVVHFSAESAAQHAEQIAAHARNPEIHAVLVDSRTSAAVGGTGVAFDWVEARKALSRSETGRIIAAGGLNPANVAEAIRALRPWGVDAVSGVEAAPGRKDAAKVREFVRRAREGNSAL